MPPRPLPDRAEAQRLAIEGELSGAQLEALAEGCRVLGIRMERWRDVPALRQTFEMFAVLQRAEMLSERKGLSETQSIVVAAGRLGINPDAIRRTRLRWQKGVRLAA